MHRPDARGDPRPCRVGAHGGRRPHQLVAYAAGLSIPFLIVLVALRRFRSVTRWLAGYRRLVDVVTGTLVAGVGILVFSGAFARLAGLFTFGVV